MQTRMDKYNTSEKKIGSRTQKNQTLYQEVKNSALTEFDINSNVSVIDEHADHIDVSKVRALLDQRYSQDTPRRKSIEVPEFEEPIVQETFQDTKEYDINAILAKAKKGKNVDYNKERLKKIRQTQYEILNNLDLELKKVDEVKSTRDREAEENLLNLINTITELEIKNKDIASKEVSKEASAALDLLEDLKDNEEKTEEVKQNDDNTVTEIVLDLNEEEKTKEQKLNETLSKLNVTMSAYDEFSDVSKNDTGSLILKIIIFILIIALIIGAIFILDQLLALGLFK